MTENRIIWSHQEVLFLITAVREHGIVPMLKKKRFRNAEVYKKLVPTFELNGFKRNYEQIRTKWKSLQKEYRQTKSAQEQSSPGVPRCNFYSQLDDLLGGTSSERIEDELPIDEIKIETETPKLLLTAPNEARLENWEDPLLTPDSQAGSTLLVFPEPRPQTLPHILETLTPDSSTPSGNSTKKSRKRISNHSTNIDLVSEILESFQNTIVEVTKAHIEAMAVEFEKQREWEKRENEAIQKANADLIHGVVGAVMKGLAKSRRGRKRKRGEVMEKSDESDSD